ncbi:Long-chain-fatty-acid-CoA ligase [Candidatus Terasakiella magnetica]|uniref:Long-chain-fatty-acid-CoA ligase n=1 Tax=Candidatus Terasakiella magnetica TaxID=1867952 RepID=A0A1C3RE60_9PROT|nr:long-chain fatty acid--CoA ligase [Candidatus Terasakiella magnetica]SCA55573.1 Long-chain-fatty-acid-CoA ligase [Candidatus Terasakiella magnetica]
MSSTYCDIKVHDTFPKILRHNAQNWPNEVAMREKEFGIWNEFTWADYHEEVKLLSVGMHELGCGKGDTVGLLGKNRPEWVWGEVAAQAIGSMSMGIYEDSLGPEAAYLINYAETKIVIAEDEEQVDKLLELEDVTSIKHIIYCDPRGMRKYDDPRLIDHAKIKEIAREALAKNPNAYDEMLEKGKPDDVSILCTTSGTTSNPKLIMLQSGPFLEHSLSYLNADPKKPGDNYVSVLPLPWIMEQVYVVSQALIARVVVNFVEEPETMMADLREIGPSFVLLAPRVWENIAADVRARMMDSTKFKQKMFEWGMKLGMEALDRGERSKLADFILFRALRDRLGFTNLTSAATGGAAMGPDTFRFFLAMGVPLKQLYGQTEMSGAYTIHKGNDIDFDSVGVPFEDVDLKIINADEEGVGEIVSKTPGMFLGYYKNEKATQEDVRDGWMHTGDAGYFKKENGHLVVIDRIKDLAETSTGVRYSPQFIENKLKFSPFVAEAVILGKDRPDLAALICIRFSIVSKWCEQKQIAFTNYTNISALPEVYAAVKDEITKVNASLPEAQQIQKFVLLYKELDADDGELTRTRKVRRNVVAEKYEEVIDAIYNGDEKVHIDTMITFQDGSKSRIVTDLKVETMNTASAISTNKAAAE